MAPTAVDSLRANSSNAIQMPSLSSPTRPPSLSFQVLSCEGFNDDQVGTQGGVEVHAFPRAVENVELLSIFRSFTTITAYDDIMYDDLLSTHLRTTAKQLQTDNRKVKTGAIS
jgi:hypothetical protein